MFGSMLDRMAHNQFLRFMWEADVAVFYDEARWRMAGQPHDLFIRDPSLFRDLFFGLEVGFMRAGTRGKWECADPEAFASKLYQDGAPKPRGWGCFWFAIPLARYYFLPALFQRLGFNPQNPWRSKRAIAAHYDMMEELIQPMLGEVFKVYSCADFRPDSYEPVREEGCTLEQAQQRKLENLCRKLCLAPMERVLDIGCGYGDTLAYMVEHYHVCGVGITLSPAQHAIACKRHARLIAEGRLEFRIQDYRDIPFGETFDKVVSVGMLEHVGRTNLRRYMYQVSRLLAPGGLGLVHSITNRESQLLQHPWIRTDIFRDSFLPSPAQIDAACSGLDVVLRNREELPKQYAYTLREWRKRFHAALRRGLRPHLVATYGKERAEEIIRMWDFYLAFCAAAFALRHISVHQWVFSKGPLKERYTFERYQRAGTHEHAEHVHG